jgi:hypothetical protein
MAIISFNTNPTTQPYSSGADAACAVDITTLPQQRFFDDTNGTEPEVGDTIFMTIAGTQADEFLADAASGIKQAGTDYWYTTDLGSGIGISLLVDEAGKVTQKYTCTQILDFETNSTTQPFEANEADACAVILDANKTQRFVETAGSSLEIGMTVYTDANATIPDTYLADGSTAKTSGTTYWYTLDLGNGNSIPIEVSDIGEIVAFGTQCTTYTAFNTTNIYSTTPAGACSGTGGTVAVRYFDDNFGTKTEPAINDTIFLDTAGNIDEYEGDGSTPKAAGTQYWYESEIDKTYLVNESGQVINIVQCTSTTGVSVGSRQTSSFDACSNSGYVNLYYTTSGNTTSSLVVGDVIWQDVDKTTPVLDGYYYLYNTDTWAQVVSGEVAAIGSCVIPFEAIQLSNPFGNQFTACNQSTPNELYTNDTVAASIVTGTIFYSDQNLQVEYDGEGSWFYEATTDKSYKIDQVGEVVDIVSCPTGPIYSVESISVLSSTQFNNICNEFGTLLNVFYVTNDGLKNIDQIASENLPIFTSFNDAEVHSNELNSGTSPTLNTVWNANIFFESSDAAEPSHLEWDGASVEWPNGGAAVECIFIVYDVFSISLKHDPDNNATSAAEFCTTNLTTSTFYYLAEEGSTLELLDLAQQDIPIFTTQQAALDQESTFLAPRQIYKSDANPIDGWFYFGDGNPAPRQWFGFTGTGDLSTGGLIETGGSCEEYERPDAYGISQINSANAFASNIFYAFWSCSPEEITGEITFNMYVIDGDHFEGDENYISDFISALKSVNYTTFELPGGNECVTFVHKVRATDIDEAELLLKSIGGYDVAGKKTIVQQKLASSIGIFSNNEIKAFEGCLKCGDPVANLYLYQFGEIDDDDFDPTLGVNFNTDKNYNIDNISRPLLRTNPKLTTNIKLVADTDDKIYLESIDATKDLANIEYKKNEVSRTGSYSYDIANFFNSKRTPSEIIYKTKRTSSDTSVLEDYQSQIEEDYQYGATLNYSKLYDEKFRIFAPIWADLNMPKMFVIFKINNPGESEELKNTNDDNLTRIKSILANAEIVKTFDLTSESAIGAYVRNHLQDDNFPEAPLTFSFEKDEKSTYNGIDLVKGGFVSKAEYLYEDFVKKDKPLIEANDFITDGFRRNSIASANILNLEFLFDDASANEYSVNRYFGLYVNDIDSGLGEVSTSTSGRIKFKSIESYVDSTNPATGIPAHSMMNNTPTLGYVSIEDSYYKIATNKYYDESNLNLEVVDSLNEISGKLGIKYKDKSIEAEDVEGAAFDYIKFTVTDNPIVNDNIAIVHTKEEVFSFKFIKHTPLSQITIEDSTGISFQFNSGSDVLDAINNFKTSFLASALSQKSTITIDELNKTIIVSEKKSGLGNIGLFVSIPNGNIIKVSNVYTNVDLYNSTIFAADSGELTKGTFNGNKFSQDGQPKDIAIAMSGCINQFSEFNAKNIGADVYVSIKIPGYKLLQHALLINQNNNIDFVSAENYDPNGFLLNLDSTILNSWRPYYFNGGASNGTSMLVKSDTISEININDYIATNYAGRFNKIKDVVEYVEDLNAGYHRLILSEPNSIGSGELRLYRENNLRIGLFSAYDIYDLNFDFYDTSNSDLKELYKEEFSNIEYKPYSTTKEWTDEDLFSYRANYEGLETSDILSEDFELSPSEYFSNLLPILDNESIVGANSKFINSEFDRLEENNVKELSLKSRVVPNINKWVLKDCDTVREQPYYLNANEAFGRTNFAPDLSVAGRDKKAFTHEWFYIDKIPNFYRYNHVNETFSYINFIQDFEITKEMFMDNNLDYFDKFMICDGLEISSNSSDLKDDRSVNFDMNTFAKKPLKKKYSIIKNGNDISFASTFFKGIKVLFRSRKEFTNQIASEYVKNNEFNGYRFSTLVKVNQDNTADGKNSIEYDVIKNEAHKFVIFFITLNISDFWIDNTLSRKMMYELNHKMVFDNSDNYGDGIGEYVYSDANLSGALNLLSVDFSGSGPYVVRGMEHNNGTDPEFDTQISPGSDGLYGRIIIEFAGSVGTWAARVATVNSNEELVLQEIPYRVDDPSIIMPVAYLSSTLLVNADYVYEGGGVNAHSKLLEKLSIQYVSKMLNSNGADINYKTITTDGTVLDNRFIINFEDGKEIIKESNLKIEEDTNKPQTFKLSSGTIGYNIVPGETYYPFLIRHSGNYTVDMRPVVTFTDLYTHFKVNRDHVSGNAVERSFEESLYRHSLNDVSEVAIARKYYNRYNRTGTTFNLGFIQDNGEHDSNWGVIKNHFYHKVNDINTKGVIKLSASSDLLPLYPLISEIAIDKKDINVFKSSWDSEYYSRSLSGGKSTNVVGTFGVIEERSYLASTMMTLEDSYLLLDYTTANVNNKEELDDILRNSNNTADIMIFEDKNNIIADFYMDSVIYKKLRDSGVLNTLIEFVNPEKSFGDKTTLIDDSQNYIIKNLIDVLTIDNLVLYTKSFKGKGSEFINTLNTGDLSSNGFESDNNFTYKPHTQTPLNFRLIYNKRLGYSYDIRPMIKIKS